MKLTFPRDFIFGTSTAAYQIETAMDHDWKGIRSKDGHLFDRTTDHEKRFEEDAAIIASLAPHYRMSLMWSKLQRGPGQPFNREAVAEYHRLLGLLRAKGVSIMMVLHHFTNPLWFTKMGGWEKKSNLVVWADYCTRLIDEFGDYVSSWNTFNEPNVYISYGWLLGGFPPNRRNVFTAWQVTRHLGQAHDMAYDLIKERFPGHPVGISHNAVIFSYENPLGWVPAKVADKWYMDFLPRHFEKVDFFGMSYYAKVSHDPFPITNIHTPHKLERMKRDFDDMWEYYPDGMRECILRYWTRYRKPIIITENGTCTADDRKRVRALQDYMLILHDLLNEGVEIRGYYHWSPWDNFEWNLGPTYRFGLYACDLETKDRIKRPSADLYSRLSHQKEIEIVSENRPSEIAVS